MTKMRGDALQKGAHPKYVNVWSVLLEKRQIKYFLIRL